MTTNNHPAHGPVSLDRLHQIREILSKAAAQSDGGNLGYAMADAVKVIDGAIAAFGAEPVAYTDRAELAFVNDMACMWTKGMGIDEVPLYAAPPVPVALGTTEIISQLEQVLDWILNTLPVPTPLTIPNARLLTNVINTCRAAMLQAGNSPVTPDGWQLVPKEPTQAMNKAGWDAMNEYDAINPTYRAMLAAAPLQAKSQHKKK